MSIYHFDKNSLIDEVVIRHTKGGGMRAYLHARDGAPTAQLDNIKKTLSQQTIEWTPIFEDGRHMLEVRSFGRKEGKLISLLERGDFVSKHYTKAAIEDDKISPADKIRHNTVSGSGFAYFAGDMSYLFTYAKREAYNIEGKLVKPQSLAAGIFYALGTPFIMLFGRGDKSNIQLKHLVYGLKHELLQENLDVPRDSAMQAVANGHNSTLKKRFITFCSRYPAEITNSIFAAAGSMILWEKAVDLKTFKWKPVKLVKEGGFKALKESLSMTHALPGRSPHDLKSVLMDMGLGALSVSAGLVSVLVEEEVPKPDEPKKTGLARVWQWVKQKPLPTAAILLLGATSSHAVSTLVDMKHVKNTLADKAEFAKLSKLDQWETNNLKAALPGRAIFVASNLIAEVLMMFSSKGHGAGVVSDVSYTRSAYAVAADLVKRTPEKDQESVIKTIANYYAGKEHLGQTEAIHERAIRKELAEMSDSPWVNSVSAAVPEKAVKDENYWRNRAAVPAVQPSLTAPAH